MQVARAPEEELAIARELQAAVIGAAYVRFVGPGDIGGVVNLNLDPNERGNPRGLTNSHVELLAEILRRPNAKKDHESPVILTVDANLIDPILRLQMSEANAYDLLSDIPRLELLSDAAQREQSLENELWLGRTATRWLDEGEVHAKNEELRALRKRRALCMLLNGNHRLRAMLKIGEEVEKEWRDLADRIRRKIGGQDEWEADVKSIFARVENLTWRCEVYDCKSINIVHFIPFSHRDSHCFPKANKLSAAGKNALVQNRHQRPAQGMGSGEKGWWLARKFAMEIDREIRAAAQEPDRVEPMHREEALNIVQAKWRADIGSKMLMTGMEDEADAVKLSDQSDSLKDITGNEPSSRLFFNPLSMEMVIDIQPALCVFDHCLERAWAIEMLRPSGGPLIAHYWLDARILIKIFSVEADEANLKAAIDFLDQDKTITPTGNHGSIQHFDKLHERFVRFPPLLEHYDVKIATKFAEFYVKALDSFKREGRPFIDENRRDAVVSLRLAFHQWGRWLLERGKGSVEKWETVVGVSACLYAYLPTYRKGAVGGSLFYPMAALPAPGIFKTYLERWSAGWAVPGNGDSLILLEELLDRGQIVWTIGAQGTGQSVNWANWYSRCRGLHQIVLRFYGALSLGPVEARLTEALSILEDPRLPISLHAVSEHFPDKRTVRDEMKRFSAQKSGGSFQCHGAEDLIEGEELTYGPFKEFASRVLLARIALKIVLWPDGGKRARKPTDPTSLEEVRAKHVVFNLVDDNVWNKLFPSWFTGWRDAEAKRMNTVCYGLGLGFFEQWFVKMKIPELLQDDRARWTLHAVQRIFKLTSHEEPWWIHEFKPREEMGIPDTLPDILTKTSKSAARKSLKEQKAATVPLESSKIATRSSDPSPPGVPAPLKKPGLTMTVELPSRKSTGGKPRSQLPSSTTKSSPKNRASQGKNKKKPRRKVASVKKLKSSATIKDESEGEGEGEVEEGGQGQGQGEGRDEGEGEGERKGGSEGDSGGDSEGGSEGGSKGGDEDEDDQLEDEEPAHAQPGPAAEVTIADELAGPLDEQGDPLGDVENAVEDDVAHGFYPNDAFNFGAEPQPSETRALDPNEFNLPFDQRRRVRHNATFQNADSTLTFYHKTVKSPHHIFAPAVPSVKMPHHAWRLVGHTAQYLNESEELLDKKYQAVLASLNLQPLAIRGFIGEIKEERCNLRESMIKVFDSVTACPLASDASYLLLPDIMAGLRDLFIARVAKLFSGFFNCSYEEGIHEATIMAQQDGMFQHQLTSVDEAGRAKLDLTCTFPSAAQSKVAKKAVITSNAIGESDEGKPAVKQSTHHMNTPV
ncbi:hypothetical protein FRC10_010877 [Ceratobasidium sp. 414]|nr:hypothetical protein FRC10_010877 [Ceratobasidium sp. 414]